MKLIPHTKKLIGTALLAGAVAAGGIGVSSTLGATTAHAATCQRGADGITYCSDGTYQYVDSRGWLIIKDAYGNVLRQLPPKGGWY